MSLRASSAPVIVNFTTPIPNADSSIVRAFITGWTRTGGKQLAIRAYDNGIMSTAVQIIVQVVGDMAISSVQLNYLIFSPYNVGFASYGGAYSENAFASSKLYSTAGNIYSSPYSFYGLTSINFGQGGSFGFSADMGSGFYLRLDALFNIEFLTVSYVTIGVPPSQACSGCSSSLLSADGCVDQCPAESYPHTYPDNGKACRSCPFLYNLVVNANRTGCTCRQGFVEKNGLCVFAQSSGSSGSFGSTGASSTTTVRPVTTAATTTTTTTTTTAVPISQTTAVPISTTTVPISTTTAPTGSGSYVPTVPSQTGNPQTATTAPAYVPPGSGSSGSATPVQYVSKDCSTLANSYWSGYRCVCRVGFVFSSGICVASSLTGGYVFRPAEFIYKLSLLYRNQPAQCSNPNEVYNGESCVCSPGYTKNPQGVCQPIAPPTNCSANSQLIGGQCVCNPGYVANGSVCIVKPCPANSYSNGLGDCICVTGYYMFNGSCVAGKPCKINSQRNAAGQCVCLPGFTDYGDYCARCPDGQLFVPPNSCVTTCGVNQVVNSATKKCECKPGYGIYEGICNLCPINFFLYNGYCVVCPIGSVYNVATGQCNCNPGFAMSPNNICLDKCTLPNEVYDVASGKCRCFEGLGRVNGVCQLCTNGYIDASQNCITGCPPNQVQEGNKCVCAAGLGIAGSGNCVNCAATPGSFLLDGYCAFCPNGQTYTSGACSCPAGQVLRAGVCSATCQNGQLIDASGNCYWCPLNEVISGNSCICKSGYQRVGLFCELQCSANQQILNGRCGTCALNTEYDPATKSCICKPGSFMNANGVCEIRQIIDPVCDTGSYLNNHACVPCSAGCKSCQNANTCTSCTDPTFTIVAGGCVAPRCGDGKVGSNEACDDGNNASGDGCSATCSVEPFFTCNNASPSKCVPVCGNGRFDGNEACDDGNSRSGDGCSASCIIESGFTCTGTPSRCSQSVVESGLTLANAVYVNFNNVFVVLSTPKAYQFPNENEMRSFMKYTFEDATTTPSSAYCLQRVAELRTFECLLIYASGVPNKVFNPRFWYDYKGDRGSLTVKVDPLASAFQTRSLR